MLLTTVKETASLLPRKAPAKTGTVPQVVRYFSPLAMLGSQDAPYNPLADPLWQVRFDNRTSQILQVLSKWYNVSKRDPNRATRHKLP